MVGTLAEIKKKIQNDIKASTEEARNETDINLRINVEGYYGGGTPKDYERTYTLLTSPETSPVSGGGNSYEFEAKMNPDFSYPYGNYNSGEDVIDATETGLRRVVGTKGYFKKTEAQAIESLDNALSKRFG